MAALLRGINVEYVIELKRQGLSLGRIIRPRSPIGPLTLYSRPNCELQNRRVRGTWQPWPSPSGQMGHWLPVLNLGTLVGKFAIMMNDDGRAIAVETLYSERMLGICLGDLIKALANEPEPVSVAEMQLLLDRSHVFRLRQVINVLQNHGLIERVSCSKDNEVPRYQLVLRYKCEAKED